MKEIDLRYTNLPDELEKWLRHQTEPILIHFDSKIHAIAIFRGYEVVLDEYLDWKDSQKPKIDPDSLPHEADAHWDDDYEGD